MPVEGNYCREGEILLLQEHGKRQEGGAGVLEANQWKIHSANREDELTKIFEGMILVLDEEGRVTHVQSELAAILGLMPEEMIRRPITEFLRSPRTFEEIVEGAGQANGSGVPTIELDGRSRSLPPNEYVVFRIEGAEGATYVLSLLKLNGDARLTLLQRFAAALMRDVNMGVLLLNPDFELVEISETACRILGVRREEALGKPLDDVFVDVPPGHRLVERTLLEGIVVKNHAISWTNDQERFELIMDTSLLKDAEGRVEGAYVLFKDVSNLRSLEQQVQRSDRLAMIGQIAAGTAHEIRNPLTSIKGFLQVLKKSLRAQGMEKEFGYAELMLSEIDRINELVSEFLLLSKPKHTTLTQIDVSAVIREILPIINNEAILHNVTVEYQSALDLPLIMADRELLKQVFINLCKNGIEAMSSEGGSLTITEKPDRLEHRLNVYVQDTGPGIPAFLIDKIFDPFFTTKEEGTGLGLSVCQRIVHDIGGTLRVSSKGYGTIFVVSIPYIRT